VIPTPRRIIFLGTPAISVPSLEALVRAGENVVGVVTQPDRPAGRGRAATPPPVKQAALALGLQVLQPPTLRRAEVVAQLRELRPDLIVIAAFGQILRPVVLELPPLGCINLHPSLLPKLRGTAPINWAILEGLPTTGVTVMVVDEVMDSGPILTQETEPVLADDTAASLGKRLASKGAALLARTVHEWALGQIEPRPQNHSEATYTRLLRREDGRIDWRQPAEEIERRVRAFYPWPGTYTSWQGGTLKVIRARLPQPNLTVVGSSGGEPGEVIGLNVAEGSSLAVATGAGTLLVDELQLEGRRVVSAAEFVRGYPSIVGSRLG
jgi:methionyl-tRNA formyltransferase